MSGNSVKRMYGNFRGVDFRGDEINIVRSPDSLNVWKDYKETESIRTRPGMALFQEFTEPIYGIFFYDNAMIVHSGTSVYEVKDGVTKQIATGARPTPSRSFVFEGIFYFMYDGSGILQYDGTTYKKVEGYVPTTTKARKPSGGGELFEDINLISDYRKNSFLGDDTSKEYLLDATNIDTDYAPECWVDGEYFNRTAGNVELYTVDYKKGKITFLEPLGKPATDGQDNVVIKFKKKVPGNAERITKCTLTQVFDNRVFFSGNPDYPNLVWHCSLHDPSYCSDYDEYEEGMDSARVTGLVAGNNALWVFREPSQSNTTIFYHTPTIDSTYGKVYPSVHSSITIGCVGKAINFNDDIVFFSERGMEGISGDVTTEQVVAHRSSLVDRKLISEANYKNMLLEEWDGYLLVIIGNKVYLANSRTAFTNEDHIEYEWFYWELEKEILCTQVKDGVLYLGTDDGIYTLSDFDCDVESYWVTALDKFQHPQKLKTTNKRGCVVEATGDISVYAKLEDTDFEHIGTYENVTDYFVCRIKRKKFKDLQLKFHSKTRFSLETATLECFVGGYIKR